MKKVRLLKSYSKFIKNFKKKKFKVDYFKIIGIALAILGIVAFSIKNEGKFVKKKAVKDNKNCICRLPPPVPTPTIKAYNSPARIDVCGIDCFLTGSYLYWQAKEKGLELGEHLQAQNSIYKNKVIPLHFNYHSAFKVGLGFYSKHDNWSLSSQYTRYYSKNSAHKTVDNFVSEETSPNVNQLRSPWFHQPNPGSSLVNYALREAKSRWKLHLNLIDLELARPYFVGKKLTFRPFIGAKGGLINQRYLFQGILSRNDPNLENIDIPVFGRFFSNSWLVGPRMGIDTNWLLGCNFRLIGNGAINLFYQRFKTNLKNGVAAENNPLSLEVEYLISEKTSYFNSSFESMVGFGWGKYSRMNKWHFDFSAGYEIQLFLNQNMIRSLVDSSSSTLVTEGSTSNLMLHGLSLSAKIDF